MSGLPQSKLFTQRSSPQILEDTYVNLEKSDQSRGGHQIRKHLSMAAGAQPGTAELRPGEKTGGAKWTRERK
eukprot:764034-Hanusia_phi.AAC.2